MFTREVQESRVPIRTAIYSRSVPAIHRNLALFDWLRNGRYQIEFRVRQCERLMSGTPILLEI